MKVDKLKGLMKEKGLDAAVFYPGDPNFRYYLQEDLMSGLLYVPVEGKPTVFVHALEELEHEFNVVNIEDKDTISDFLEEQGLSRIGYNASEVTVERFYKLKNQFGVKDVGDEMEEIRKVKTEEELAHLNKAARLADDIMRNFINQFDFKTEEEIKRFLKMQMAAAGVEKSFEPVVASGRGAAIPHYSDSKELEEGFLIIDMGVKVNGYCSDITRTFYLGEPSREERKLYQKVLEVQKECIEKCTEGTKCSAVYNYAKDVLGENFTHGLGHGIGLRIHELPNLKERSEDVFRENMAFTVEPGWYDVEEGIGIRIEDDVSIKDGEPKRLTKTSRELRTFSI